MNKIKFYPRVFLFVFAILFFIGVVYIKGNEYSNIQGKYEKLNIAEYIVKSSGYKIDSYGNFHVENDDPQLWFDFTKLDSKIYGICIDFDNKITLSSVQIYYGRDGLDFSEIDSKHLKGGKNKQIEEISSEGFSYIRLDINEDFKLVDFKIAKDLSITKIDFKYKYLLMSVMNLMISAVLALSEKIHKLLKTGYLIACEKCKNIKWKNILKNFLLSIVIIFLSVVIENVFRLIKEKEYINKYRMLIIFCVFSIITFSLKYQKIIKNYFHIYFFILSMMIGTIHVIAAPPSVGISWDDEIHYGRTSYLSRGATGYISDNDNRMINRYVKTIQQKDVYNYAGRVKWTKDINENTIGNSMLIKTDKYSLGYSYISYIPAAFGLNFGRCLGLNFTHTFMFGKWMNLFTYSCIFAYSVKLLKKRGCILVALIGLIPTSLFMATSYSYDWWIISLCVLGYSLFINELQSKHKIGVKKFIIIMFIMIIAILPKAVYFILIFPMLCLKKEKYENSKFCRIMAITAMLILVASFILPMFASGVGEGDSRGNSGVNATEQVAFILTHPIEYSKILIKFLLEYLSLNSANGYLTLMAYYGQTKYYIICILLIVIGSVLDNVTIKDIKNSNIFLKLVVIISAAFSVVLVATALYIDFTPVQYKTILGCQSRYLLPLIFPCIYFISELNLNVPEKLKSNIYIFGTTIMSFIFLYGIYFMCIKYY